MSFNMFALPPVQPPRYAATLGVPMVDAKNTVEYPTGPEWQLQLTEGTYTLHDDFLLGQIPPHPSEPVAPNPNVLDPKLKPPECGTKLSIAVVSSRRPQPKVRRGTTANGTALPARISEHPRDVSPTDGLLNGYAQNVRSRYGENNPALAQTQSKDQSKRRKPKNNVAKSNSSFLSRAIIHEQLAKKIQDRNPDGAFAFANINRAVLFLDLSSPTKTDQLAKLLFTKAHALCLDFNTHSKTPQHLDVAIGFNSSDLIWWEAVTQKYARLNKNGIINPTPVCDIKWLPGSENLFLAAHADGTLIVYDKERDDAPFIPDSDPSSNRTPTTPIPLSATSSNSQSQRPPPTLHILKSVLSPSQKNNPVSAYRPSPSRPTALAFSPSGTTLALASEDGTLRLIDLLTETLTDVYTSYYGGLTCVAWSPDGEYIATGGQDDLVCIWSVGARELVARCVGHHSWVTGVSWDAWRCDGRSYRIGSVGADARLCLWDFEMGMLRRPRVGSTRPSVSSAVHWEGRGQNPNASSASLGKMNSAGGGGGGGARRPDTASTVQDSMNSEDEEPDGAREHLVMPRAAVAMLPPVLSRVVDSEGLMWLGFEEDAIITTCKRGHIRTWDRPKEDAGDASGLPNPFKS